MPFARMSACLCVKFQSISRLPPIETTQSSPSFLFRVSITLSSECRRRPSGPVIAKSGDVGGSWFFSEVYAVPKAELVKFDGALPPTPWFGWKEEGHKYLAGHIHVRPILDVFDNRVRIEKSYRIQRVEDSFSVDLMSENQGNPWVKRAWSGLCCGLPALAISVSVVLAGLWVVRRGKRR